MAFGLWRVWKCKNEAVFTGIHILPHVAVDLWRQQVEEFRDATVKDEREQWMEVQE